MVGVIFSVFWVNNCGNNFKWIQFTGDNYVIVFNALYLVY